MERAVVLATGSQITINEMPYELLNKYWKVRQYDIST
jgi:hypothetical protein